MRIEQIVTVFAAAFVLENAMAAPIEPAAEPQDRSDVQAEERSQSDELVTEERGAGDEASDAEAPRCALDGCQYPHQACVCSNTGWNGYCGFGPHHPGCLYCRCD